MPKLFWLVQNFDYKHAKNPKHYLQKYLKKYSKEFYSLDNIFTEIDCGSLPTPCAPEDLGNKDKLSKKYLDKLEELKLSLVKAKTKTNFSELIRFVYYLLQHNTDSDFDEQKIKEIRKRIIRESAWRTSTQYFHKVIKETKMLPTIDFNKQLINLRKQCIELFQKHLLGQEISKGIIEKLKAQLVKFSKQARSANRDKIQIYLDELIEAVSHKAKEFYANLTLPVKTVSLFDEKNYLEKHLNKKYAGEEITKIAFRKKDMLLKQHYQDCQTRNHAALIEFIQSYGEQFVDIYRKEMQLIFIDKNQPVSDLGSLFDKSIMVANKIFRNLDDWIIKHVLLKSEQKTRLQEISTLNNKFKEINNQRIYNSMETFGNKHMIKFQKQLQGINLPDEDSVVDNKANYICKEF